MEKTKRSSTFRLAVQKRYNMTCQKCGCRTSKLHAHHIIPLDEGGPDTPENGTLLCSRCHIEWEGVYKSLDFSEWMKLPTALELLATFINEPVWRRDISAPAGPDFAGDDVYAADEVACPHCGHTLRVVMRATLSVETAPEDDDEGVGR